MNNLFKAVSLGITLIALMTACKKSNNNTPVSKKNVQVQVVHAAPRAGELTVEADGAKTQHKVLYLNAPKGYAALQTGEPSTIKLLAANNTVVAEGKYSLSNKGNYTLFIYDTLRNNKVKIVWLQDKLTAPGAGKTNIRFLHLSPNTGRVDIDVFKGSDSIRLINDAAFIGDSPNENALSPFRVIASGTYRVKVKTKSGTRITTLLDIPNFKLDEQRSVTVYLRGLTGGTTGSELGLQTWQHK